MITIDPARSVALIESPHAWTTSQNRLAGLDFTLVVNLGWISYLSCLSYISMGTIFANMNETKEVLLSPADFHMK